MNADNLVILVDNSQVDSVVDHLISNPVHLGEHDAAVEAAARAKPGESWAPKLAPYEPWVAKAESPKGTDGDLFVVGALGMGISDEMRLKLTERALRGSDDGTQGGTLSAGSLRTLGTRRGGPGSGQGDEAAGSGAVRSGFGEPRGGDVAEPWVSVRRDEGGYVLSAFRLSRWQEERAFEDDSSDALGAKALVIAVPASIGGVPVVRIASEAFKRRYTGGVAVTAVVVPDAVKSIGAEAFSSLCAKTIVLGRGVEAYSPAKLDLSIPSPRLESRAYEVVGGNDSLKSFEGNLLAADGGTLLFAAAPYGERLMVPAGTSVIGSNALAAGCMAPRVIEAPASLRRVDAKVPPETVWMSPDPEALCDVVRRCGGRVAGPAAFELEGCWYDVLAGGEIGGQDVAAAGSQVPASADDVGGGTAGLRVSANVGGGAEVDGRAARAGGGAEEVDGEAAEADRDEGSLLLVAGPPAPDSVSRKFSQAAHWRLGMGSETTDVRNGRGGSETGGSPRDAAAAAASAMVQPKSSSDRLSLPSEIDGRPLRRIGERALLTTPAAVVIPCGVWEIGDGNACWGARRLVLPEGLRTIGDFCFCSRTLEAPVVIPSTVVAIGTGSFEYATVRFEANGAVVHISSDPLMSCFVGEESAGAAPAAETSRPAHAIAAKEARDAASPAFGGPRSSEVLLADVPFDFARYDELLLTGRGMPDHTGALLHRIATPVNLAPETRWRIVALLRDREREAIAAAAREGDLAVIRGLAAGGFVNGGNFDALCEGLRRCNRTDCVLYLMEWNKERRQGQGASAHRRSRDRFAL